jgi:hypothetical protein
MKRTPSLVWAAGLAAGLFVTTGGAAGANVGLTALPQSTALPQLTQEPPPTAA